jgi:triacylglycerol lipase
MPSPASVIVFHHGLILPGNVRVGPARVGSFVGIDRLCSERGYVPVLTQVHPTASVHRRAAQLKRAVLEQIECLVSPQVRRDCRIAIVAHSMGGLDARHMIAHLGMSERVAALVTLSTPHRGSAYADWCLTHLTRFGAMQLLRSIGLDVGAAKDLTTERCETFNQRTRNVAGVRYYSISAARPLRSISPLLMPSYLIVRKAEGANDGLVSVRSARWGRHLGTWPVDHLHVLNRRFTIELLTRRGDVRPRYLKVFEQLERDGVLAPGEGFSPPMNTDEHR